MGGLFTKLGACCFVLFSQNLLAQPSLSNAQPLKDLEAGAISEILSVIPAKRSAPPLASPALPLNRSRVLGTAEAETVSPITDELNKLQRQPRKPASVSAVSEHSEIASHGLVALLALLALVLGMAAFQWSSRVIAVDLPAASAASITVQQADPEYRMSVEVRSGKWTAVLRNTKTYELIEIGTPADGAVFAAECLPTSDRLRLGVEHGWETLVYRKKKGFRKTSEPLNPAIRPHPEKIALLQTLGLVRKPPQS